MPRSLPRAQKVFALAVAVAIVLSLFPARWLRWTSDIADIVRFPMQPFLDLGRGATVWLKPPQRVAATESELKLQEERDRFERLFLAEQIRVTELEFQLEQLQQIPVERRPGVNWIIANVTRGNPRSRSALVDVNRGWRHGIEAGTVAIYGGVHLVGRVVEDVSAFSSRVEPITSIDLIRGRLVPRDAPEMRLEAAPLVQLRMRPDGTFLIDSVARDHPVEPGDIVRLHDRDWPPSAQAMILGEVESVEPNDKDPLRSLIIVRPHFRLHALASVTLYVESPEPALDQQRSQAR